MNAHGRILIVEDDEAIRRLLSMALTDEGYDVAIAPDGAEGLHMVLSFQPDLIFLDVTMPVMDGKTFLAEYFKETTTGQRAPVIALTAAHNLNDVVELGVDDFIAKPFPIERVLTYAQRYTRKARTRS
ncbi:MAG: response regulator transcription factor [Anaerolineae bacterium]|nr:response regulator transcription factor [Anaerolineae bacterium]